MKQTLIKFILGISIVIFIFWNRFLRTYTEHNLDIIQLTFFQLVCRIILIFVFLCILFINIRLLFKPKKSLLKNLKIQYILKYIKEYITESPEYIYERITKNQRMNFIEKPIHYLAKNYFYPHIIGIGLWQLPQLIIATIFVIDIIYFHQLKYFFFSLNLLIIYILTRVLWFILESNSRRNMDYSYLYLKAESLPDTRVAINLKDIKDFPPNGLSFQQACKQYHNLIRNLVNNNQINIWLRECDGVKTYYSSYFRIYTSLCFVVGWSYYLYLILV